MKRIGSWLGRPLLRALLGWSAVVLTGCGAAPRADERAAGNAARTEAGTSDARAAPSPSPAMPAGRTDTDAAAPTGTRSALYRVRLLAAADTLARLTRVPFVAPLYLGGAPDDDSTFATIVHAEPGGYRVVLGAEGCDGATVCRNGELTGQRISLGTPVPDGARVTFPGLGVATFQESTCGASCGDAVLTWHQDGMRYSVSMKAADLEDFSPVVASLARLP